MKKRAEKANSMFSNFLSKGKKLVTVPGAPRPDTDADKIEYDFDSGSDDDLIEIRPHNQAAMSSGGATSLTKAGSKSKHDEEEFQQISMDQVHEAIIDKAERHTKPS